MTYNVAIIGAGLIGKKRAAALGQDRLIAVADVNLAAAKLLARQFGAKAFKKWQEVVSLKEVDIIIVSTPNKILMPIVLAALKAHKHVLCEKPLGRNLNEARKMYLAAQKYRRVLKTGFNHRHHPAVWEAKQLVAKGIIGDICYSRCVYGHGGRLGYEKEWRADKKICGGGELLDQGVHVIDLLRWFQGDFKSAFGNVETVFWPMKVEDNGFAIFKDQKGRVAMMHTSWTQWKNRFVFEVYGEKGYLIIEGLGGSYGTETLVIGRRPKNFGAPYEERKQYPGDDQSWAREWREFIAAIRTGRQPLGNGWDGYQAMKMIEAVYRSARSGKIEKILKGV